MDNTGFDSVLSTSNNSTDDMDDLDAMFGLSDDELAKNENIVLI